MTVDCLRFLSLGARDRGQGRNLICGAYVVDAATAAEAVMSGSCRGLTILHLRPEAELGPDDFNRASANLFCPVVIVLDESRDGLGAGTPRRLPGMWPRKV